MNRDQLSAWMEALMDAHRDGGEITNEILRGAFELDEEVRKQWGQVAQLRAGVRYSSSDRLPPKERIERKPTRWDPSYLNGLRGTLEPRKVIRSLCDVEWAKCMECGLHRVAGQLTLIWSVVAWRAVAGRCGPRSEIIGGSHSWESEEEPGWMRETVQEETK